MILFRNRKIKYHIMLKDDSLIFIFSHYCHTCSILFSNDQQSNHTNHNYIQILDHEQFYQPCRYLLQPKENKHTNAQFFFTQTFIDYLINKILLPNSWDSFICIGCPTIYENLQ